MPATEQQIRVQLERRGVAVTGSQLGQLSFYIGLITKWNATVNLTALTLSPLSEEAIDRLLVEPLIGARALPEPTAPLPAGGTHEKATNASALAATSPTHSSEGASTVPEGPALLVDIGSGGGSPAIPLKIARPDFQLMMVESKARKSAFLRDVIRQLSLASASVVTDRLENLVELRPDGPVENRPVPPCGKVGAVSLRAVRADRALWDTIRELLRPGGIVLWFRSAASQDASPDADSALELFETRPLIAERGSELALLRRVR